MEIPQTGRAIINDGFDNVQIIIPAKKNYMMLIMPFVAIGVFVWFIGPQFFKNFPGWQNGDEFFPKIWLVWVGFVLLSGLRISWWNIAGKEVIEGGQGVLTIKRKGDWLSRSRAYDLAEARFFRADDSNDAYYNNVFDNFTGNYNKPGTVRFEYGAKTIRFGEALSQAEGNYILQKLRDKGVLTDAHFIS